MSKPVFNPNKPFTVVDSKPAFDPNKPFEDASAPQQGGDKYGLGETVASKAAEGLSFGYSPQAAGLLEPVTRGLGRMFSNDVISPITGKPIPKEQSIPDSTYLAERDKEVRKLKQMSDESPITSTASNVAGAALPALLTGGGSLPATAMQAAKTGALVAGLSNPGDVEGEISPVQGRDRMLNAAGGFVMGGAGQKIGGLVGKAGRSLGLSAPVNESAERSLIGNNASILSSKTPEDIAQEATKKGTSAVSALKEKVMSNQANGLSPDLPGSDILKQAVDAVPEMTTKPLPMHYEMAKNKALRADLDVNLRNSSDKGTAEAIAQYENQMKQEASKISDDIIENQVGYRPKFDSTKEAGENLKEIVGDIYKKEKESIGPLFEKFQNVRLPKQATTVNLKSKIYEALPELESHLMPDESGGLVLSAWDKSMPIGKKEYGEISEALRSINSGKSSVKEVQNIRRDIRRAIDPTNPNETANLSKFNSALLSHIEDSIALKNPTLGGEVRGAFKDYAVNEQKREVLEKILGAKIDSSEFAKVAPEDFINRSFKNSENAKFLKSHIGPEEFENLAGDWIKSNAQKFVDNKTGHISANRFNTWLIKNQEKVIEGIGPEKFNKLKSLNTIQQFTSDLAPFNTSNTESAMAKRGLVGSVLNPIGAAKDMVEEYINKGLSSKEANKRVEQIVSGKIAPPPEAGLLRKGVSKIAPKFGNAIQNSSGLLGGYLGGKMMHE